jgi:hypothetical protein
MDNSADNHARNKKKNLHIKRYDTESGSKILRVPARKRGVSRKSCTDELHRSSTAPWTWILESTRHKAYRRILSLWGIPKASPTQLHRDSLRTDNSALLEASLIDIASKSA